jgi:hypothetical protein
MELKNYDYTGGPYFSSKKYDIHPLSKNGFTQYIGTDSYVHQYLNNHITDKKIIKLNKELEGKNFNLNNNYNKDSMTNNKKITIDNEKYSDYNTEKINNSNNHNVDNYSKNSNNENFSDNNYNNNDKDNNNGNNYNYNYNEKENNNYNNNNRINRSSNINEKLINSKMRPKTSNPLSNKTNKKVNLNLELKEDANYNNNLFTVTRKNSFMQSTKNSKLKSKPFFNNENNNINNFSNKVKFLNSNNNNNKKPILDFEPFNNKSYSVFSNNFKSKSKIKGNFDINNIPRLHKTIDENNYNNHNPLNQLTKRLIQTCKGRRPNNYEINYQNEDIKLMQNIKNENERLKEIFFSDKKNRISKKESFPKVAFIADQPHLIIKEFRYGDENKILLKGKNFSNKNNNIYSTKKN